MSEENKAISNRVAEAIGRGDLGTFDELMAPELAEEFKRSVAELRRAFPDYAGTNVEQISEGGTVANRFVFLGTHLGEYMGVAPTGRRVEFVGNSIDRVVEGRVVESWVEVDLLCVLKQLGAVAEGGALRKRAPRDQPRGRTVRRAETVTTEIAVEMRIALETRST